MKSKVSVIIPIYNSEKYLIECLNSASNQSLKDIEIMRGKGIKRAVTIVIRNPLSSYRPKNNHIVEIKHADYKDERWNVEDIRPKPDYITLLLKGEVNGDLGN